MCQLSVFFLSSRCSCDLSPPPYFAVLNCEIYIYIVKLTHVHAIDESNKSKLNRNLRSRADLLNNNLHD